MSLKIYFPIILKILNLSLFFQIFRKCLLKRHFLNCLIEEDYFLNYIFFKIFLNFFIIFRKVHKSTCHVAYDLRVLLYDTTSIKKKRHHNFIRIIIFVIYYKIGKKMGSKYLYHLIFTLFKFTLKNFLFLKMISEIMMSPTFSMVKKGGQPRNLLSRVTNIDNTLKGWVLKMMTDNDNIYNNT